MGIFKHKLRELKQFVIAWAYNAYNVIPHDARVYMYAVRFKMVPA